MLIICSATNYEQQIFSSKSDWRVRAISATHLPLRLQHIYVSNDDVKDGASAFTYLSQEHTPQFHCCRRSANSSGRILVQSLTP